MDYQNLCKLRRNIIDATEEQALETHYRKYRIDTMPGSDKCRIWGRNVLNYLVSYQQSQVHK